MPGTEQTAVSRASYAESPGLAAHHFNRGTTFFYGGPATDANGDQTHCFNYLRPDAEGSGNEEANGQSQSELEYTPRK